jgi:hypothetical protein
MENDQSQPTQLSLGDLVDLKNIVEVASTRGAFQAKELSVVGRVYDKLSAFLAEAAPPAAPENQEEAPADSSDQTIPTKGD